MTQTPVCQSTTLPNPKERVAETCDIARVRSQCVFFPFWARHPPSLMTVNVIRVVSYPCRANCCRDGRGFIRSGIFCPILPCHSGGWVFVIWLVQLLTEPLLSLSFLRPMDLFFCTGLLSGCKIHNHEIMQNLNQIKYFLSSVLHTAWVR